MVIYVKITGGNVVTSARAGEYTPYENYVTGHVEQNDEKAYPLAVAIAYMDGPADSITLRTLDGREYPVSKERCWGVIADKTSPPCTTILMPTVAIKYPVEGTYSVWLVAGYAVGDTIYATDYRPYTVYVTSPPQPSPTPTPTPTPTPPQPSPTPQVPMEWFMLFLFFILAVAVIVAAVRR